MKKIRDMRSLIIGHPTDTTIRETKQKCSNVINRWDMQLAKFQLIKRTSNKAGSQYENIEMFNLIQQHNSIINTYLKDLIRQIEDERMNEAKEYLKERLSQFFPDDIDYGCGVIFTAIHERRDFAREPFDLIEFKTCIIKLQESLKRKKMFSSDWTEDTNRIIYALDELIKYFSNPLNQGKNKDYAHIFAYFIQAEMNSLKETAYDIDEENEEMAESK